MKKIKEQYDKKFGKTGSLLYEFSRGNQVDGLPRAFIMKAITKAKTRFSDNRGFSTSNIEN